VRNEVNQKKNDNDETDEKQGVDTRDTVTPTEEIDLWFVMRKTLVDLVIEQSNPIQCVHDGCR